MRILQQSFEINLIWPISETQIYIISIHSVYFYMMDKFNANIYCWKKKKTSKLNLSVLTQDLQWGVMLEGSNQPECVMRLDAKQLPSQSGIFSYKITPWIYGWVTKKKILKI